MAFNLRKLFDQASAQLNPFDHGQTASTVRANQAAIAPAQTIRRPQNSLTNNPVTRGFSRAYDQANVFDNGRTYKQRTPVNTLSAFDQATHNGATNLVGNSFVKPLVRTSMALNQGIGDAELAVAGRPTQNANEYFNRQSGLSGVKEVTGYTGTKRQVAGDIITNASNIAAPGSSKLLEAGAAKVLPKVIPKIIPKIISTAAVGAPVGTVSNVGSYVSGNEPITKQGLIQTARQGAEFGAAGGAILPVAGALAGKAAIQGGKVATKAIQTVDKANKAAALNAAIRRAGIQSVKVDKLTPTDQTGYGDLSRPRVDYYKQQIQAGRKPAAIAVVKDNNGTNFVEDGKHRLQAYKELGYKDVPARVTTPEKIKSLSQRGGGQPFLPLDEARNGAEDASSSPASLPGKDGEVLGNGPKDKSRPPASGPSQKRVPTSSRQDASLPPTIPPEAGQPRKFTQDQVVSRKQIINDHPVLTGKDANPPQPVGKILADRNQQVVPQGPEAGALPVEPIKTGKKLTRYASKNIPTSERVSPAVQESTKAAAPSYVPVTEQGRYADANARLSRQGDTAFHADVQSRLDLPNIDHQTVADAQTLAQKYDTAGDTASLQKATDLYTKLSEHLTRAGQTVQAAAIMAKRTPEGLAHSARRTLQKGGVELTEQLQLDLKEATDKIRKTKPGTSERDQAVRELSKKVVDSLPQSTADNLVSIWKAGLLSGVKTQGGNFVSNATFGVLKKASDIPSTLADKAISLVSKKRTTTITGRGLAAGTKEGLVKGKETLKTGIDSRAVADKYEQYGEINLKNKYLQKAFGTPANYVFRGMNAADQPFYFSALKNSLYDQAKAEGFNRGLRGTDLAKYMETAVKTPTERMAEVAKREADKSVLGYDTFASKAISWAHRGIDSLQGASDAGKTAAHTALNVLMPFVRVPSAFISRTIDFTPLGIGKEVLRQVAHKEFDQRALSQAIGEGITGTGVVALGIALAQQGQLSGAYPKNDAKEQQRWKTEGITPNSVKLGRTWVSLNYLGPVGLLFGAGKNLEDAKTEDAAAKAGNALAGLGQGLLGQSFLTGLTGFNDALQDPNRSAKSFLNSEAASTVPAFLNDAANATDKYQRQADTPTQAVKNRIPGLRETNQPKQDVYGNPLEQPTTGANVFSPLKPSDARSNAVTGEVTRLHNADPKNSDLQVTPTPIAKSVSFGAKDAGGKSISTNLSDKQRYDLQSKVGQSIQSAWGKLIATDEYKSLSDVDKAQALSSLRTDVTQAAEAKYASDNTLGQYANDYTGSSTKPSKAVSAILDGNLDVASYARSGDTKNSTVLKNDSRGTALLDKVGSLNSGQLKKWKGSQTFDAKYQDLYDRASQIRFGGLPDLPKNNQVLGLYADLLKKRTNDLTPFGENKAKMQFLKDAYKTELPKDAQEILSASASDILNGLDSGYITRDQISQAIQYDNTILTNKLSGSPDISNKVRKALGFGAAPAVGGGTAKNKFNYDLYGFGNPISTNRHLRDLVKSAKLA